MINYGNINHALFLATRCGYSKEQARMTLKSDLERIVFDWSII